MVTHADNVRAQVAFLVDNARSIPDSVWQMLKPEDREAAIEVYVRKIEELMTDELSLATVRDKSDVIVHADGPALSAGKWSFRAFNSVVDSLNAALRGLVADSLVKVSQRSLTSKAIRQQVDVQVTGFAPGSLYVGANVAILEKTEFFDYNDVEQLVESAVNSLPLAGSLVTVKGISDEISDVLEDPAVRDSALVAASLLSPSGKIGVNEVSVTGNGKGQLVRAILTPEKRHILRRAIKSGAIGKNSGHEKVKGVVREVNLDTSRFSLRSSDGFLVRCFLKGLDHVTATKMLDKEVVVEGTAQKDKEGRVRLIALSNIPLILSTT